MGVRVDQAGHHDAAAAVDPFGRRVLARIRPDRHDRVTRHGDSARLVMENWASMVRTVACLEQDVAETDMVSAHAVVAASRRDAFRTP